MLTYCKKRTQEEWLYMRENAWMKKVIEIKDLILTWLKGMSLKQLILLGSVGVLSVVLIVTSIVMLSSANKEMQVSGMELAEGTEAILLETETITEATEEIEMTEATEETEATEVTEVEEVVKLHMQVVSIEKDLKVKIVDENDNLVKGQSFLVTITKEGSSKDQQYTDNNKDGIIYVDSISAGTYTVKLHVIEGFVIEEDTTTATVKETIEYKKVEIKNEIKSEKEIDASKEDTAEKEVKVEEESKDTLPLLESTVVTTEIAKENVDLTDFPDAEVSTKRNSLKMNKVQASTSKISAKSLLVLGDEKASDEDVNVDSIEDEEGKEDIELPESTENTDLPENTESTELPENAESTELPDNTELPESTENTDTKEETKEDVVLATAKVTIPKTVKLYPLGKDSSKTALVSLKITDKSNIILGWDWKVDNTDVADILVSEDKKSATVFAKNKGEVQLTVNVTYQMNEAETYTDSVTCNVTVADYADKEQQIKDTNGNLLYADAQANSIATQNGYVNAKKFYANPIYTGWQTINGSLYYYTEEHIPATGKQIIGGGKYEFAEDGALIQQEETRGIDVSKWQGKIDWKAVAGAGIDFAIIRCGYRGSSTGALVEDPYFKQNIKGATENGIKVGVYFFTQAITKAEAVEEASMALELVKDYKLQMPIYIDTEGSGGRADSLSKSKRTKIVKAFCETIKNAGYKAGIYASKNWYLNKLDTSDLSYYHIWVAQYNTKCTYEGRYDSWQYSSNGKVPGIKGRVDMNICYTKY